MFSENHFEGVKIRAFDFNSREPIGEYDSMSEACKKLYIRQAGYIFSYLNGKIDHTQHNSKTTFKGKRRGVKSYKTGTLYHFEKA